MIQELQSSVCLLDNHYSSDNLFGAKVLTSPDALIQENQTTHKCFALNLQLIHESQLQNLLNTIRLRNPLSQIILFETQHYHSPLISAINTFKIFKLLYDRDESSLYKSIIEAIHESDLSEQNENLIQLLQEKHSKLLDLTSDLEIRVRHRQESLEEAKQKLITANKNYAALHQCLVGIQKASGIPEIEKNLIASLAEPLKIKIIKIQFHNIGYQIDTTAKNIFKCTLELNEPYEGSILFFKKADETFKKDDQSFLKQISSAVSLALKKLENEQLINEIQQQWQITFDAIEEPVALISETHEVLQWNLAYSKFSPSAKKSCYKILFNKDSPCENCHLGNSFKLPILQTQKHKDSLYTVESRYIESIENKKIYLNIYRDQVEQKKVERQILESSKMGELGLIGSSIAHELNNPLAGLITFIQMLKSECQATGDLHNDILDMEKAALRCKDIIQNLLSFSRKSSDKNIPLHIEDIINKALRVLNVKTKPLGIQIQVFFPPHSGQIIGQENPLTQACINILQNSIDSVIERKKIDPTFNPDIKVYVSQNGGQLSVDFYDNGLVLNTEQQLKAFTPFYTTKSLKTHRGLGLTLAFQIIKDHSGSIDIVQISPEQKRVRVHLPKSN